jgi:hypothetical protein
MNSTLRITLTASPEQAQALLALQAAFARVCNALAPLVQQTRCWNRVTLHHLAYKSLREQFPEIGSQMVCNAIYSVSRTAREVFQHPQSPFHIARLGSKPLPLLRFGDDCRVYFDRHTLSVKDGALSLYTLDGRMRFVLALSNEEERAFRERKLREVVLSRQTDAAFQLAFWFADTEESESAGASRAPERAQPDIPKYVRVEAAT